MFRALLCAIVGFGLVLDAASTRAGELEFSFESRLVADSNVFRRTVGDEKVADGSFEISPRIRGSEKNSTLTYDFSYSPTYEKYFETSRIDGVDHSAFGVIGWQPTARDTLSLSSRFSSDRRVQLTLDGGPTTISPPLVGSDRVRVNRANGTLSYQRALTQSLSINGAASIIDFRTLRSTATDNSKARSRVYSGQLGLQRVMNPRTTIGISASGRRRSGSGQVDSTGNVWTISASVNRALSPTANLSIAAGPSFIKSVQKGFNNGGFPFRSESSDTTVFAEVKFDQSWRRLTFNASYSRSESRSEGSGTSAVSDDVIFQFFYDYDRRTTFRTFTSWNRRVQLGGNGSAKVISYNAIATVERSIIPRLTLVGRYLFVRSFSTGNSPTSSSLGNVHTGFLAIRYTFDPLVY